MTRQEERKKYYNPEKKSEQNRRGYQKYRKKRLEKQRIYRLQKRQSDPIYKFSQALRKRIREYIVYQGGGKKSKSTQELLGCSFKSCREHLQSLWKKGMSWENYGLHGWHIDHIKPITSFDLTDPEEQKKCFHYTNLQPLWAEENLKKGNRIDVYERIDLEKSH